MAGRDGTDEVMSVGTTRAGKDIDGGRSVDGDLAAGALVEIDPEVLAEGLAEGLIGWLTTGGGVVDIVLPPDCSLVKTAMWRSIIRILISMSRHMPCHWATSPSSSSILTRCLLRLAAALSRLRLRRCSFRHVMSSSLVMVSAVGGA